MKPADTSAPPYLSALPYAPPRSALPGIVWPAVPDDAASRMLALQFQLEHSQWWPPEVIEARQFEQLRLVLEHSIRTVPFYGSRLAAAGFNPSIPIDREVWARIPILTRREVQLNASALRSSHPPPRHGAISDVTTSGSTGRAITVPVTELHGLFWQAITLREHLWHQRDLGGKLASIRSRGTGTAQYPDGLVAAGWGPSTDLIYRTGPCAMLNHACSMAEKADWLMRQDPDYLLTSATNALELARHFRRTGLRLATLREVRTYGEMLPGDLRDTCLDVWGVKVVDMYSSEEIGYMALQCPQNEHYHVQAENVLLEIVDDHGHPCREDEIGRVIVSTLHNFAMPLIRYEIGDYAEAGGSCSCGRGLPVLKRILGRVRNALRIADGGRRWPDFGLAKKYRDLPAVQLQVVQTALDALELRVVPGEGFSATDEARLLGYFRDWAGPQFRISLRVVEEIPRGPGGKFEEFMTQFGDET
jgi:phenylacetate-CoA ligase